MDASGFSTISPTLDYVSNTPITEILQLIAILAWTCLNLTTRGKNPIFDQVLPSISVITELLYSSSIVFCPGLFDILQASTAPTLAQLKSLPTNFSKRWGIYLLTLEKPLCLPKIYIGSGTSAASGVTARLNMYTTGHGLPKYVVEALNNGYIITHKGLLLWAPIPSAEDVPLLRALFVLLEATFCFVFWAVMSKNDGDFYSFGITSLCSWILKDLPYAGLCSHNPLIEKLGADFSLSAEDLAALQKARKRNEAARKLPANQAQFAGNVSSKRFFCAVCNYPAAHKSNLDNHNKSKRHLRKANPALAPPPARNANIRARNIANKRYHCAICNYAATHQQNLDVHLASEKHRQKALQSSSGSSP